MLGHVPDEEKLDKRLIARFHFAEFDVRHECLLTGIRVKGKLENVTAETYFFDAREDFVFKNVNFGGKE